MRDTNPPDEIAAPAKIREGHVADRHVSVVAGSPRAWRNSAEHPLTLAYDRGQLDVVLHNETGRPISPHERYETGMAYRHDCEIIARTGRDSTDMDRISGGNGEITLAQADAIKRLISVDSHMAHADRRIARLVCGEGHSPSSAITQVCGAGYYRAVSARLCEALDALVVAWDRASFSRWAVNLSHRSKP